MPNKEFDGRITKNADFFGLAYMMRQTAEEAAELIQVLQKIPMALDECKIDELGHLVTHLAEEMADVEICMDQLNYLLDLDYDIHAWRDIKLERQMSRIEEMERKTEENLHKIREYEKRSKKSRRKRGKKNAE